MVETKVCPRMADWFDDAPELNRSDRGAGKKRSKEEVVPGTDHRDDIVILEVLNKIERTEAGAKDYKSWFCVGHGGAMLWGRLSQEEYCSWISTGRTSFMEPVRYPCRSRVMYVKS